ncbi:hypothetical protein KFL_001400210 [Klebsormidium nitens]|uniref:Uncharacterized protein n=1 Tax=Klebsormidium nitens TaxID=105231 RepID=A0A1Y1I3A5_KLENI|nr:hypothetical protein KFL_001400210 [Klebsormidium nitens]|eukprot:GAQ83237.1 hypothetical protein KFL_001400210 [Klebsormidium nitens]
MGGSMRSSGAVDELGNAGMGMQLFAVIFSIALSRVLALRGFLVGGSWLPSCHIFSQAVESIENLIRAGGAVCNVPHLSSSGGRGR